MFDRQSVESWSQSKKELVHASVQAAVDDMHRYDPRAGYLASELYDRNPELADKQLSASFAKKISSILEVIYYIDNYTYDLKKYNNVRQRLVSESDDDNEFRDNFLLILSELMPKLQENQHSDEFAGELLEYIAKGCLSNQDRMPRHALTEEWRYIMSSKDKLSPRRTCELHALALGDICGVIEKAIENNENEKQKKIDEFYSK